MYVEIVHNGSYFVFPAVQMLAWLKGSNTLVVETVSGRHEFTGVDRELWAKINEYVMPNAALYINLDKKKVAMLGPF